MYSHAWAHKLYYSYWPPKSISIRSTNLTLTHIFPTSHSPYIAIKTQAVTLDHATSSFNFRRHAYLSPFGLEPLIAAHPGLLTRVCSRLTAMYLMIIDSHTKHTEAIHKYVRFVHEHIRVRLTTPNPCYFVPSRLSVILSHGLIWMELTVSSRTLRDS